MYSIWYNKTEKDKNGIVSVKRQEKKIAKGIAKSEIKKTLKHDTYKQCLFNETVTYNSMNSIRSSNHKLYMDTIVKKGLCSFDDKRYWINSTESMQLDIIKQTSFNLY